jgi:hypothetical protein
LPTPSIPSVASLNSKPWKKIEFGSMIILKLYTLSSLTTASQVSKSTKGKGRDIQQPRYSYLWGCPPTKATEGGSDKYKR